MWRRRPSSCPRLVHARPTCSAHVRRPASPISVEHCKGESGCNPLERSPRHLVRIADLADQSSLFSLSLERKRSVATTTTALETRAPVDSPKRAYPRNCHVNETSAGEKCDADGRCPPLTYVSESRTSARTKRTSSLGHMIVV